MVLRAARSLAVALTLGIGTSLVAVASAPSEPPAESTVSGAAAFVPDEIEWNATGPRLEEGWLDVPVDYADPDGATFRLFLVRHLADPAERIGTMLVNPGGPGYSGADTATSVGDWFGGEVTKRFDIVGWDVRGSGRSEPAIDCIDDYDDYFAGYDITPDDDAERQAIVDVARGFANGCTSNNADIIQFVGTNNSARDMDVIRRALGEDQITYFGSSYGSWLGAAWATLFPGTVRAAVLAGSLDPRMVDDVTDQLLQQAAGFERALTAYLTWCSTYSVCTFQNDGDAAAAFDALMLELETEPIPSMPGRPDITHGVALRAVGTSLYLTRMWASLSVALAAAQEGDGVGLLGLWDDYYLRNSTTGEWPNTLEAAQTIRCMDSVARPTVAEDDARVPEFHRVAPRYTPGTTGRYFCTFFPPPDDPLQPMTGAGAGPLVVCGTDGDPATPLAGSRHLAADLEDGRLIVIRGDQHLCYGVNPCADELIEDYLINLVAPPPETDCSA